MPSSRRWGPPAALSDDEIALIRAIGDNTGSMALKGGAPDYDGEAVADRWPLDDELREVAARWAIDPDAALRQSTT